MLPGDGDTEFVALVGAPSRSRTSRPFLGVTANENVVPAFARVDFVETTAADKDVVAGNRVEPRNGLKLSPGAPSCVPSSNAVVAFIADFRSWLGAIDKNRHLHSKVVVPVNDEVLTVPTEDDIRHLERQW